MMLELSICIGSFAGCKLSK